MRELFASYGYQTPTVAVYSPATFRIGFALAFAARGDGSGDLPRVASSASEIDGGSVKTGPTQACRFVVRGRVQGVGFRWFVWREAERLSLEGYVRNRADGSVEVLARGSPDAMARLTDILSRGPTMAHVEFVEKEDVSHDMELPKPFDIN